MTLEEIFKEENDSTDIFDGFEDFDLNDYESNIEEPLEKTLDIEVLDLNQYLPGEDVNKLLNTEETAEVSSPIVNTSNNSEKDNSMQEAFINCSVLGFITAFIGAFWFINIINCL